MPDPFGVHLLPASGEWVYDTVVHRSQQTTQTAPVVQNLNMTGSGTKTDFSYAIDQLQATYPGCRTVSLVCAWFGNSTSAATCAIYPSTTYIGGTSEATGKGGWRTDDWRCSGLTQASPGLIPLSTSGGSSVYGGTPSDPSIVRAIRDLKTRGFRVVFYPFLLMDCAGYPWRGRIGVATDMTITATTAVMAFLGSATPSQFTRDATNLTVAYAGAATDWTYRRMILHYANLCVVAGGVDLFLIGSELCGLETVRGRRWTKAGVVAADGSTGWDYPFVAGLAQLAADVRAVFDGAGLVRDVAGLHNLVTYSADWSNWMGVQHAGANGQWPHLDQLYADPAIDLVAFDNYLPLSDWTSAGGLDAVNWSTPAPTIWPPPASAMNGLGLAGAPLLASKAYLKANVEGGEKHAWFYANSTNAGRGFDPNGSAAQVSRPAGDRASQSRTPYNAGQEILANKKLRWWWGNPHRAVYDTGDGQGWVARGGASAWVPQSKPITFAEYGVPTCDRCTNQPNVFYDPKSSESFTPYWSAWEPAEGGLYRPVRDDTLASLARDALVEYWTSDGHNATSAAGVRMIETAFMCAWNWDARPFPAFPASGVWGDGVNWRAGTWIGGKGPSQPPSPPDASVTTTPSGTLPTLQALGWSITYRPVFTTDDVAHASGRETRAGRNASPLWEIGLGFDGLDDVVRADVQTLGAFYAVRQGRAAPFLVATPPETGFGQVDQGSDSGSADHGAASDPGTSVQDLGLASTPSLMPCRFAEDQLEVEQFMSHLYATRSVTLRMVRL